MKKILFGTLILISFFSVTSCVKVTFEDDATVTPPADSTSNVITGNYFLKPLLCKGQVCSQGLCICDRRCDPDF